MKKTFLLLVFGLFAANSAFAQRDNFYSILFQENPGYYHALYNTMQQRDGDFVINTFIFEDTGNPEMADPVGNMFYKVSSATLAITDSLFVADPVQKAYVFARDPRGDGNIKATFDYHEECDSTFLRISHFPDYDLNVNPDEDIMVPICEGQAFVDFNGHIVDCHGDLIIKYYMERPDGTYDDYIVRIDREGTLENQALLFEDSDLIVKPFDVLKESPLQYYQWEPSSTTEIRPNLAIVVIDSLFNKNTVILNKTLREETIYVEGVSHTHYEYLSINYQTMVIPIGGDDILVAAEYRSDTNYSPIHSEYGVAVAKYDIRTMQLKGYVVFNDHPGFYNRGRCFGLKKMSDGTVYFVYWEHPESNESVIVVKMDTDLNVEWKRLCKTADIIPSYPFELSAVYEDDTNEEKGIVWSGYAWKGDNNDKSGLLHFFLNHDGTVGTNEGGIEVRPYTYYPNPAQDRLRLQYSPDVQPKLVELYDLQGRLVRTQRQGLESLDMSQLPTGIYTMRVTMEDGQTFSDKVVKE